MGQSHSAACGFGSALARGLADDFGAGSPRQIRGTRRGAKARLRSRRENRLRRPIPAERSEPRAPRRRSRRSANGVDAVAHRSSLDKGRLRPTR